MKKTRIVMILLSLLLAISCSGGVPTADLKVRNDSEVAVGYSMDTVEGTRIGVLLPGASKLEKDVPQGDAAVVYWGKDGRQSERIAVATVGKDSEIVLTMGEAVPKSIYSSIPGYGNSRDLDMTASGRSSLYIFNEDGTGWKTSMNLDAGLAVDPTGLAGTVAIGWKTEGSFIIISEKGKTPVRFSLSGDVLANGNLRWKKVPDGEVAENKTLDGVWNILGVRPLAPGLPSPALMQLVVKENDIRLLATYNAAGIPGEDFSSEMRADLEIDMTEAVSGIINGLDSIESKAYFSGNGGIAVIDVKLGIESIKIPLVRGNAEAEIEPWKGTEKVTAGTLTLKQLLDRIGATVIPVEGQDITVNQTLSVFDMVISADGTPVDISGTWKVGDVTWTTDYGVSVSSDGRMVFIEPERSGFTVYELIHGDGKVPALLDCGYYNVARDGNALTYTGRDSRTAAFVAASEKSITRLADESIACIFKDRTSEDFRIELADGLLKVTMPSLKAGDHDVELKLGTVTAADGRIGFVTGTAQILENLTALGVKLPSDIVKVPTVGIDVVFPLNAEGKVVLGKVGGTEIAF